jgi:OmpA-OmpF porin, OOP family
MRKITTVFALASTAVGSSHALAHNKTWYAGIESGVVADKASINLSSIDSAGNVGAATLKTKVGIDSDAVLGYNFGHFRLEGELGYKTIHVRRQFPETINGVPVNILHNTTAYVSGVNSPLTYMGNALIDFGKDRGVRFSLGAGAGMAHVKQQLALTYLDPYIRDASTKFAWQLLAEARVPVSNHFDFGLKYRYFNVNNLSTTDSKGASVTSGFKTNSLLASFIYNFGGRSASPPMPLPVVPVPVTSTPEVQSPPPAPSVSVYTKAPPPVPAPKTAPQCVANPYIVYFDFDKSYLTPEAAFVLDTAVKNYSVACNGAAVHLSGYADNTGSHRYNLGLSQRRNASVGHYLSGKGISPNVITSDAHGNTELKIPTPHGVREVQNRRVEVQVAH